MPIQSIYRDLELPNVSLLTYILNGPASRDPKGIALIDSDTGECQTFLEFQKNTLAVAKALHALGIKKGDTVALCLPNCLEYPSILLAITSRGAIACGINSAYTEDEFEYHIPHSTAQFVFVSNESLRNVQATVRKLKGNQKLIMVGDIDKKAYPDILRFQDLLDSYASHKDPPVVSMNPTLDPACMMYSSGTTGRPKGVLHSHGTLTAAVEVIHYPPISDMPKKGDTIIHMLPMFHVFGISIMLYSLRSGVTLVVMRKYTNERLLILIEKYKIVSLICVPPILVYLAKDRLVDKYDLTSLQKIFAGAAPIGKELTDELFARHPNIKQLNQGYGMSEMGVACFFTPRWLPKAGSCGIVLPNYTAKVINLETGAECAPNEPGEICIKGILFLGYFRNPQATAEIIDKDGWLHTGDIGYYDEDFCFFIVDRVKELIKVKGFQVPPAELEDLLLKHPAVDDVAVIGINDQLYGEVPKAFVVKKPSVQITEKELIQFVQNHVIYYKRLKGGVEFVHSIPRAPSGKILRRILRQRANEKQVISKL